mmetsp:Transcript_30062/g.82558  ORF Transcript_30062/g.82558 Transcript_30062/m.82558 type:complete len:425 (-) Transcript_30062:198-1472(-)
MDFITDDVAHFKEPSATAAVSQRESSEPAPEAPIAPNPPQGPRPSPRPHVRLRSVLGGDGVAADSERVNPLARGPVMPTTPQQLWTWTHAHSGEVTPSPRDAEKSLQLPPLSPKKESSPGAARRPVQPLPSELARNRSVATMPRPRLPHWQPGGPMGDPETPPACEKSAGNVLKVDALETPAIKVMPPNGGREQCDGNSSPKDPLRSGENSVKAGSVALAATAETDARNAVEEEGALILSSLGDFSLGPSPRRGNGRGLRRHHLAEETSQLGLGTREVLQGALDDCASAARPTKPDPRELRGRHVRLSVDSSVWVRPLPPGVPYEPRAELSPRAQPRRSPRPPPRREVPLYLRMNQQFASNEERRVHEAQARRHACLAVRAAPAPMLLRRPRRGKARLAGPTKKPKEARARRPRQPARRTDEAN